MSGEPAEEGLVGISICGNQLRMAEVVARSGNKNISRVASGEITIPFEFDNIRKRENIASIAREINNLYEAGGFESTRASFSLDSEKVLIRKIPVDFPVDATDMREHALWEASQVMINPLEDYIVDFHVQDAIGNENERILVLVVVRKAIIDYLKEVFASTNLHLRGVDVDIFAAQRVVENTYDITDEAKVALIDIRDKSVQFSILHHGFFLEQTMELGAEIPADKGEKNGFLSRMISKEMRRLILDNKLGKSMDDMQEVFVYGEEVDENIIETLVSDHDVNLHRVNPFERITLEKAPVDPDVTKHPEAYVASVGTAIKGL